jgi:hypothetical protein
MGVVLIEDLFQEGDVRLDDSRIEVLNELCQLAHVGGLVAKGRAAYHEYENCDREELLHLLFCPIKSDPARCARNDSTRAAVINAPIV